MQSTPHLKNTSHSSCYVSYKRTHLEKTSREVLRRNNYTYLRIPGTALRACRGLGPLCLPLFRKVLLHCNDLAQIILGQRARLLLEAILRLLHLFQLPRHTFLAGCQSRTLLHESLQLHGVSTIRRKFRRVEVRVDSTRYPHVFLALFLDCWLLVALAVVGAGPVRAAARRL